MEDLKLSKIFYHTICKYKQKPKFYTAAGVTIFAPIDPPSKENTANFKAQFSGDNLETYIISDFLGYTQELYPGDTYISDAGTDIAITSGPTGEKLVNGRRIVKGDVITTNGVIHFIEGVGPLRPS